MFFNTFKAVSFQKTLNTCTCYIVWILGTMCEYTGLVHIFKCNSISLFYITMSYYFDKTIIRRVDLDLILGYEKPETYNTRDTEEFLLKQK